MNIKKIRKIINKRHQEIYFLFVLIIFIFWIYITTIPKGFQPNTLINIEEGENLRSIAIDLKDHGLIKSSSAFSFFLTIQGKDDNIVAGEYLFHKPISIFEIGKRLTKGEYGIEPRTVILKEGFTLAQMSYTLEQIYPKFDSERFDELTSGFEGYFFPDTYVFPENVETDKIVETLKKTFEQKINEISDLIDNSPHSLDEIIIMASIIEKESTDDGRQEVANILWHRMEIDMPLQVDATFVYERGKGTFDLTKADLKEDSPYNTYVNLGLPPTAISNPGLESIKAAANPQETENLYFLTGMDGEMYYADSFEKHKENRRLYLDV